MVQDGDGLVRRLAWWGIPFSLGILGLKILAWQVTGSVALMSDALESIVNVAAAFIAFFVVSYARKPADKDHQFGHHKAEYISAVAEGVLIVVAALLIAREAWDGLFAPRLPDAPLLGMAINGGAALLNGIWATVLIRAGRTHHSPALLADGQHIMSDVVTSGGVLIGLLLAILTGYAILDPLLAIIVAANILFQGWKVILQSVNGLMDRAVTPEEEEAIRLAIKANSDGCIGVHDLRTRRAASAAFIDFHLVVPANMTVGEAHAICDRLEEAIKADIEGASLAIHVEPEGVKAHGARVMIG